MTKRYNFLHILLVALISTACGTLPVQAQPDAQTRSKAATYEVVLGKTLQDKEVLAFLAGNHCTPSGQYQLCQAAGLSLWADAERIIRTVRLYLDNADGFSSYRGELPYGLKFYDIQGAVEYKLAKLDRERSFQSEAGRPEENSSPDHFHYWAFYKRYKMIIVYNSPFADEDATIHSILVSQ